MQILTKGVSVKRWHGQKFEKKNQIRGMGNRDGDLMAMTQKTLSRANWLYLHQSHNARGK